MKPLPQPSSSLLCFAQFPPFASYALPAVCGGEGGTSDGFAAAASSSFFSSVASASASSVFPSAPSTGAAAVSSASSVAGAAASVCASPPAACSPSAGAAASTPPADGAAASAPSACAEGSSAAPPSVTASAGFASSGTPASSSAVAAAPAAGTVASASASAAAAAADASTTAAAAATGSGSPTKTGREWRVTAIWRSSLLRLASCVWWWITCASSDSARRWSRACLYSFMRYHTIFLDGCFAGASGSTTGKFASSRRMSEYEMSCAFAVSAARYLCSSVGGAVMCGRSTYSRVTCSSTRMLRSSRLPAPSSAAALRRTASTPARKLSTCTSFGMCWIAFSAYPRTSSPAVHTRFSFASRPSASGSASKSFSALSVSPRVHHAIRTAL
eukprot:Rhum_TRINITY_DN8767_c0_g1::Rhum_TRINITY_DN8767_c0_g1_i1::g.29841::m.29841